MSLTHVSPKRPNRVYVRKFDHEEARRRYAAGESTVALAREYGVTYAAVGRVVSQRQARSAAHREQSARLAGRCDRCGGFMNQMSRYHGSRLCAECAMDDLATSVRPDSLRCKTCQEWKPDDRFPRNRGGPKRRRGRHDQCRVCNTAQRSAYRERSKVPCIGCGKPALPPNEKGARGAAFPRCRECFYAGVKPTADEVGEPREERSA